MTYGAYIIHEMVLKRLLTECQLKDFITVNKMKSLNKS